MFKRRSLESCKRFTKYGYTLYENNKICIVKHYNNIKWYFKDIYDCFADFIYGIILIISFPFILLYNLYQFIPNIYIKDGNIDEEDQLKRADKEDK